MIKKDKLKWGILGCGGIAGKFAEALQNTEDTIMYAAASRSSEKASEFKDKWGFQKSYDSYKQLTQDPDVDIIYIATPHSYHFAHTKLCLEAGKHVLCEKPFTINADQLKILINLAKKKGLFMMEALWTRFLPGINKAKELIDQGAIGEVISLEADFGINFPYDPDHRIFNPKLAGGALLDIGIYPLFLSMYMFGTPSVLKAHSVLNADLIDLSTSMITQSAEGPVCHLNSTIRANTPVKARFFGTKGSIEFDNWWFTPVNFTLRTEDHEEEMSFPPLANGYEYEAIEATKCVRSGLSESPMMSSEFSLALMETMDRIRNLCGLIYPKEIEAYDMPYGWDEL